MWNGLGDSLPKNKEWRKKKEFKCLGKPGKHVVTKQPS